MKTAKITALARKLMPLAMRSRPRKRAAICAVEMCLKNNLKPELWANVIYLAIRACQTKSLGFIWEAWIVFPSVPRLDTTKKRLDLTA
jgi:hypothetical protein